MILFLSFFGIQNPFEVNSPFTVQFTPELTETRMRDSNWNGNMPVNSLDNAPVLFTIGETIASVSLVCYDIS